MTQTAIAVIMVMAITVMAVALLGLIYFTYILTYKIKQLSNIHTFWNNKIFDVRLAALHNNKDFTKLLSYDDMYNCIMKFEEMLKLKHSFKNKIEDFIVNQEIYDFVIKLEKENPKWMLN